ncbi:hypothetical protein BFI44_19815 [Yersinia pestis subsp. microtus bv. Altaica]|nr:hypothetical protein BFI40_19830 [Yersinia pestis subsp. microtus bv. Altaica]OUY87845.1 hypothetical protein BFI44_19815 [Yersinia pestis subsp. microtus bv. Altaica]
MKSIQKCDCNYLVRFAVSDSFIRDNSFRSLLAIFMVTIFVPNTAFSQLYVNNANDPGCYVIADGGFTGVTNSDQNCYTLSLNNINTNGGQLFVGGKGGIAGKPSFIATPWTGTFTTAVGTSNVATAYGFIATPWTGTFTTAVGTSNVATAYGFVVQSNGAFINGDTYVKGGLFLNGRKATNLAPATISSTSTDAVVGSQLYTVIQDGTRYFHANSVNPQDSVPAGQDAIAVGPATVVNGNNGIGIGSSAVVGPSAVGGIAIGPNTQATGIASTALGAGSTAQGAQSLALGAGAAASQANSIALGASSVTTVGAESDYSAYGLTAPQTSVGEVGVGTAQGNRKITGVAAGSADYDVVNVAQLTAVGDKVEQNTADITSLGGRVTNVEGGMTRITNGGGIKYFHTHSTEPDSVASGSDSVAIGPNAQASGTASVASGKGTLASGNGAVAIGDAASVSAEGSVALGQGSADNGRGAESYTGKYSTTDNTTSGTVSVGNAATGETRTVSNVADGREAMDAVNLRQLDGAMAAVGDTVSGLQNGTDGMFQVNNNSGQAKPSVTGTDAMAGGGRLRGVWQPQYRDGYGQQGDGGKQHRAGGQLSGGS